ncbi:ladderlectin-like isoform X1 [Sebastes fasciatus]|uniref:ladderlectin-like isoform X1 n=1 Tax=Sebastes fasciatus TaxID=394691 RepID=UPI003D9EE51C
MKMLTVSLLVCAVMALTRAASVPEAELVEKTGPLIPEVKSHVFKWSSPCFSDWTDSSGRCFLYVPTPMTWANAERQCQDYGGNLASVHSVDEQQFIQGLILSITEKNALTWLGAFDAQQEGLWLWSDGTPFKFDYWDRGQPDNNRGDSHCLVMNYSDRKKFDDTPCSLLRPSVCAKKP